MADVDPRLEACALAVGPLLACGSPTTVARAVLQEWLKHPSTPAMKAEAQVDTIGGIPGTTVAGAAYEAMCAQAAREITG